MHTEKGIHQYPLEGQKEAVDTSNGPFVAIQIAIFHVCSDNIIKIYEARPLQTCCQYPVSRCDDLYITFAHRKQYTLSAELVRYSKDTFILTDTGYIFLQCLFLL